MLTSILDGLLMGVLGGAAIFVTERLVSRWRKRRLAVKIAAEKKSCTPRST
jgi:hypothetical protein